MNFLIYIRCCRSHGNVRGGGAHMEISGRADILHVFFHLVEWSKFSIYGPLKEIKVKASYTASNIIGFKHKICMKTTPGDSLSGAIEGEKLLVDQAFIFSRGLDNVIKVSLLRRLQRRRL